MRHRCACLHGTLPLQGCKESMLADVPLQMISARIDAAPAGGSCGWPRAHYQRLCASSKICRAPWVRLHMSKACSTARPQLLTMT